MDLTALPEEVGQLTSLTTLNLSGNRLTALPEEVGQLTSLTTLNLGANRLTALPEEVGQLTSLTTLNLSGNRLTALPEEVGQLTSLTTLDLGANRLTALPEEVGQLTSLTTLNLGANRLTALPEEVGQLTSLTTLNLFSNQLTALPEAVVQLTSLTTLNLGANRLTALPEAVVQLTSLTTLDLGSNRLTALPEAVVQLTSLTTLNLGANRLTALPEEVGQLASLTTLVLGRNRLTALPEAVGQLTNLTYLYLRGNPLAYPPPAVVADGSEAVLSFLRAVREFGAQRQWRAKLLLVGEGGAGKTTLLNVLLDEDPNRHEGESTQGLDIRELPLPHPKQPGVVMRLSGWDFGGQHIYHATHQFFLTDQSLFLLVWDARAGWEHAKVRYWLDIIAARTSTGPNGSAAPVILIATRSQSRAPDLPVGELRRDHPNILAVAEVDSLAQDEVDNGIGELREHIAHAAAGLPQMGATWPVSWLTARQAIRHSEHRHMSWDYFQDLLASAGITAPGQRRAITASLHQLGEILHYPQDEELADTVVLKPAWLSQRIADILDCRPVADRHGLLTTEDIIREWADLGPDLRTKVLSMMDRYDVSYRITDTADDARAIVVDRLPWEPPDYLDHWQGLAPPNSRELRLHWILSGTVPPGIPGWFIARAHRFATTGFRPWRTGVLLADPGHRHLGLLQLERNTVQLTVRGPHPAGFLGILDLDFTQAVLRRYPGLPVVRAVPCPEPACTSSWPHEQLLERERLGKTTVECGTSLRDIAIANLLDGISAAQPAQAYPAFLAAAVNRLEAGLARISSQIDLASEAQREQAELAHLRFSQLMSWTQATSPTVLTLTEKKPHIPGVHRYLLRLYCAEPNAIHQLPGKRGCYDVTILNDHIGAFARRLHLVIGLLSAVTGLTAPVLGLTAPELLARNKDDLEKARHALESMGKATNVIAGELFQHDLPGGGTPTEADARIIADLLKPLRANDNWGGLIKTTTPGGLTLYLCEDHHRAYNAPSPRPLDL